MGAQDERQTWVELPFWRQIKYYILAWIAGIFTGFIFFAIGIYTDWYIQLALTIFVVHFWIGPSLIGIICIVAYVNHRKPKKKGGDKKRQTNSQPS
jgi:ABC-type amino acid transport system permease subunit